MKSILASFFLVLLFAGAAFTQTPQRINYQSVVRNTTGEVLQNQTIGLRISILQGSDTGPAVFAETHTPTTNNYGLINIQIGSGTNLGPQLNSINWEANVYYIAVQIDPNGGTSYSILSTSQLVSVPYALHAKTVEQNDDADADPSNEFNTGASLSGQTLQITDNGGTLSVDLSSLECDADCDPTNEIQTITKVGGIITLSGGGGAVTDDVNDADSNPTNELVTNVTLTGTTLNIFDAAGAHSVSLASITGADASATNELNTSANLTGNTLNIIDAGGTISVNLSSLINDADANPTNELNTSANLTAGNVLQITDAGGTISVNLSSLVNDADASTTNEINTAINLAGTTLSITDGGGTLSVNLASLQDGVNDADSNPTNELQTLSLVGSDLTISGGNTITLGSGTDSQNLTVIGNTLSITNGNTVVLPGATDTDDQTLSVLGNNLTIADGNTVALPQQTLSIVGSNLTISGGNTVALPGGTDTDDQTLSLVGANLTIADGNTVTLPLQTHFVGEHFGGGIIVWVDSTGQHGLICAYADVAGTYLFQNVNSANLIATSKTDGLVNTTALISGAGAPYPAAVAADGYSSGGFTDWYLPSIYELEMLMQSNYVLGNFALSYGSTLFYWSSSQDATAAGINAWRISNGPMNITSFGEAAVSARVRCVRKF
ncbi:MAG: DUF1566 domain-containing protein [Crocinitomicaceae bacterium]|jgi:hypothetical protein|nr:DUF1566 domain-containing protein [Crocinitomicaceae bacterium]MBK9591521.1 DUF1566 domain-containing protein [Crocinitomicaceae bacterium]